MDVVDDRAMRRYLLDRCGLSAKPTARRDRLERVLLRLGRFVGAPELSGVPLSR
ncbi:MAG: hypothetical protein QF570_17185 [Myxococcota bacterium]|jgi:hypothetical protein|nr:hypothetical protein [Myxococcota bacterium]